MEIKTCYFKLIDMEDIMLYRIKNDTLNKATGLLLASAMLFFSVLPVAAVPSNEMPEEVYLGDLAASPTLKNLDYYDVKNSNSWAKEAIYESGALGILKGFGNKQFGLTGILSKEEAIALAYRAAGREEDAQKAAEMLDSLRREQDKKTDALSMWSDGYLQLAAQEGLISLGDLEQALEQEPGEADQGRFNRKAPAQRQDMAFWLAKTLNLQPVYGQQEIFNSYNDWRNADPIRIPYIEAILQNKVMNGDNNGYFRPAEPLTREQAAQVIKNSENLIFPLLELEKRTGTIEDIISIKDFSGEAGLLKNTFNIRNSSGKLHQIKTETLYDPPGYFKNEQNARPVPGAEKELVVYKNSTIGSSSLLKRGDRIEYIVTLDKTVKYVRVVPGMVQEGYIAARINSIDTANSSINVTQLFRLNGPDIDSAGDISFDMDDESINAEYGYSSNVLVTISGKRATIDELKPDMSVILTIQRGGMVSAIKTADLGISPEERNIIKGIVEENNPQLGFITLYNENGTGTSPAEGGQLSLLRTYSYINPNHVEAYKNHKYASIEEIEPGDTAFIKIDNDGNVVSISAVDNYTVKYGRVVSKRLSNIAVEYDNGEQQVLNIDSSTLVISNNKAGGYNNLKDGDRIKILLHITNNFTKIKKIAVENEGHYISNVYKGTVSYLDDMSNSLVIQNMQTFHTGKWRLADQKGFTGIRMAERCDIYFNDNGFNGDSVNKYFKNCEAYIAVEKGYGGEELAVLVSFRGEDDTEALYDDNITNPSPSTGGFRLLGDTSRISLGEGSIIIKDGKLVSGSSISEGDRAYVAANRSYGSGEYKAGVVLIKERPGIDFIEVYRARIKSIEEGVGFTVESFSRLKGYYWEYSNTPRTFNLNFETRILDTEGVTGLRDFTGHGENSFTGRTVYILADSSTNARLISTAPYGAVNIRGEIYKTTGGPLGEEGIEQEETQGLVLRNARVLNPNSYLWTGEQDMSLGILENSVVLKDNRIASPSDLKKGDKVRIIKSESNDSGDAYIIIVEE
jgi:hypothetical protein